MQGDGNIITTLNRDMILVDIEVLLLLSPITVCVVRIQCFLPNIIETELK